MSQKKPGSCLCGAVTFEVSGPLRPVINCHCGQCRKTSGHYVAATSAARDAVSINGDISWYRSSDTARRGFCPKCGSNLFWDGPGLNISIFAGSLDDTGDLQTEGNIFVADKGAYYEITDGLPCAAQDDETLTTMV